VFRDLPVPLPSEPSGGVHDATAAPACQQAGVCPVHFDAPDDAHFRCKPGTQEQFIRQILGFRPPAWNRRWFPSGYGCVAAPELL